MPFQPINVADVYRSAASFSGAATQDAFNVANNVRQGAVDKFRAETDRINADTQRFNADTSRQHLDIYREQNQIRKGELAQDRFKTKLDIAKEGRLADKDMWDRLIKGYELQEGALKLLFGDDKQDGKGGFDPTVAASLFRSETDNREQRRIAQNLVGRMHAKQAADLSAGNAQEFMDSTASVALLLNGGYMPQEPAAVLQREFGLTLNKHDYNTTTKDSGVPGPNELQATNPAALVVHNFVEALHIDHPEELNGGATRVEVTPQEIQEAMEELKGGLNQEDIGPVVAKRIKNLGVKWPEADDEQRDIIRHDIEVLSTAADRIKQQRLEYAGKAFDQGMGLLTMETEQKFMKTLGILENDLGRYKNMDTLPKVAGFQSTVNALVSRARGENFRLRPEHLADPQIRASVVGDILQAVAMHVVKEEEFPNSYMKQTLEEAERRSREGGLQPLDVNNPNPEDAGSLIDYVFAHTDQMLEEYGTIWQTSEAIVGKKVRATIAAEKDGKPTTPTNYRYVEKLEIARSKERETNAKYALSSLVREVLATQGGDRYTVEQIYNTIQYVQAKEDGIQPGQGFRQDDKNSPPPVSGSNQVDPDVLMTVKATEHFHNTTLRLILDGTRNGNPDLVDKNWRHNNTLDLVKDLADAKVPMGEGDSVVMYSDFAYQGGLDSNYTLRSVNYPSRHAYESIWLAAKVFRNGDVVNYDEKYKPGDARLLQNIAKEIDNAYKNGNALTAAYGIETLKSLGHGPKELAGKLYSIQQRAQQLDGITRGELTTEQAMQIAQSMFNEDDTGFNSWIEKNNITTEDAFRTKIQERLVQERDKLAVYSTILNNVRFDPETQEPIVPAPAKGESFNDFSRRMADKQIQEQGLFWINQQEGLPELPAVVRRNLQAGAGATIQEEFMVLTDQNPAAYESMMLMLRQQMVEPKKVFTMEDRLTVPQALKNDSDRPVFAGKMRLQVPGDMGARLQAHPDSARTVFNNLLSSTGYKLLSHEFVTESLVVSHDAGGREYITVDFEFTQPLTQREWAADKGHAFVFHTLPKIKKSVSAVKEAVLPSNPIRQQGKRQMREALEDSFRQPNKSPQEVQRERDYYKQFEQPGEQPPPATKNYGKREDGSEKGPGFLGEIPMTDGSGRIMTELSAEVGPPGNTVLIPVLVPTLSKEQIEWLQAGNPPTKQIMDKALDHSIQRLHEGKSPFF